MIKKGILEKLYELKESLKLSAEDKITIDEAIKIIKKASNWQKCASAVEMLVKLMGIGSNYF